WESQGVFLSIKQPKTAQNNQLSFGELESLSCTSKTVFFTLPLTRITCQEAHNAKVVFSCFAFLNEGSCDPKASSYCLAFESSPFYTYNNIVLIEGCFTCFKRSCNNVSLQFSSKVLLEFSSVYINLTCTWAK